MDLRQAPPLFGLDRSGHLEIVVHGVWERSVDGKTRLSNGSIPVVSRSLLKPWRALSAGTLGSEPWWTLAFGSHSGEAVHLEGLRRMARAFALEPRWLRCPPAYPMDPARAFKLRASNTPPSSLFHPCSGEHLSLLAACKHRGLPVGGYWRPTHPIHRSLTSMLSDVAGKGIHWIQDGCGLPTPVLSVRDHVALWSRLAEDTSAEAIRLKQLWTQNPRLLGGEGRLDTELVEIGEGRLLAKQGADGLFVLQTLPTRRTRGTTCFLKLASGQSPSHVGIGLWIGLSSWSKIPAELRPAKDYLRRRLDEWVPPGQQLVSFLR